jgi:CRISPR-associated endonuclease/helicase Cas3
MTSELIAHVKKKIDNSWAEPHWLNQHLNGTAYLAAVFARKFDSEQWGRLLGLGHDTGKSTEKWQKYLSVVSGYDEEAHLEGKSGKLDHSAPGAKLAEEVFGKGIGRVLSYCIAGHHAGLPDWYPDEAGAHSSLSNRLATADTNEIPASIKEIFKIEKKPNLPYQFSRDSIDLAIWIRLLFSTIVDADFLDTEKYMNVNNTGLRGGYSGMAELLTRFNSYMAVKTKNAPQTVVNTTRQAVLADCRESASHRPGIFSLNVPTGGGKTLSSLAFALEHAVKYDFDRVIYVIPYTSIIEQNADVFRDVLGDDQVVEHHSSISENENDVKSRLATENWDAPVIVTTSVQFFESLFASKTSRCRKLHNIVKSVVVLDEAQLVPVDYLSPIIEAIKFLSERYNVTFVISTATQPAFETRDGFHGLTKGSVYEIVKDVPKLFHSLDRVEVKYPSNFQKPDNWNTIAEDVKKNDRVLCVVSDRKSCRELHKLMPTGTYHLSALMCGQHRSDIIAEIKKQLKQDVPVRVISTQLVEAGVDLDFPVVYRAMAGLDSIAQAAGRCNREGLLQRKGEMVIFVPPKNAPPGILRKASETTEILLKTGIQNPLNYLNFTTFFSELYWKSNSLDKHEIVKKLTPDATDCAIQFRTAAMKFKIIDDTMQRSIIVPYRKGMSYLEELKKIGPERHLMRKLQRYTVNVYTRDFALMLNRGSIEEILPDIFVLVTNEYDEQIGLWVDDIPDNPDLFIM